MYTTLGFINSNLAFLMTFPKIRSLIAVNTQLDVIDRQLARFTNCPSNFNTECNSFQMRLVICTNVAFACITIWNAALFFA